MDWHRLPADISQHSPILNLIQHVRHADPQDPLYAFLSRRAVRICVSPEVAQAIASTGRVNGPIFTIPNGLDLALLPPARRSAERNIPFLISGYKVPKLAARIEEAVAAQGISCETILRPLPRSDYLDLLSRSRSALLLPRRSEGCFLPALEAMAMGVSIVCPDCIGNRSFCLDQVNSWRPPYEQDAIIQAVLDMLKSGQNRRQAIQSAARATAATRDLQAERAAFLSIVSEIDNLWKRP